MTETERIQKYLDEIYGADRYRAEYEAFKGFFAVSVDPDRRPSHAIALGPTAAHAHAALDELHDLALSRPITLTEAHEFFPWVGRSTLNEWARTGKVAAHRSGKVWITTRTAIQAMINKDAKMIYSVEKNDKGNWQVIGPDGVEAEFTTKWEAEDFAYEMNEQARS